MLAEPDGLWGAVGETDHVVFPACVRPVEHLYSDYLPVANMVPEFQAQDDVALVVSRRLSESIDIYSSRLTRRSKSRMHLPPRHHDQLQ
jgi:hypothetical protein